LEKADIRSPAIPIADVVGGMANRPILVIADGSDRLLGLVAPFDLL
jgi:hypothetical protein